MKIIQSTFLRIHKGELTNYSEIKLHITTWMSVDPLVGYLTSPFRSKVRVTASRLLLSLLIWREGSMLVADGAQARELAKHHTQTITYSIFIYI